jgi:hypothetical protein
MAKTKKPPPSTHDEFVFWVRRPSPHYSFNLQHDRRIDDPYNEHQSLSFIADCIYPDRFKDREASAQFFARESLAAGSELRKRRPEEPDKAVGSIMAGKARFEVGGFLPPHICWELAAAMAAGTITSMNANAFWVGRGHAYLNSISFHGPEFDPVAYVG